MRMVADVGALIEDLIYRGVDGGMFTQRSPIMQDVWIRYGVDGDSEPVDLLLMAHWGHSSSRLADVLERRLLAGLPADEARAAEVRSGIAPIESTVAARLSFRQLMLGALPLTTWWNEYLMRDGQLADYLHDAQALAGLSALLQARLVGKPGPAGSPKIHADLVWLARVAGGMWMLLNRFPNGLAQATSEEIEQWQRSTHDVDAVLRAFFELFGGVHKPAPDEGELLWAVHRNRRATIAIRESTAAVKADAARHVFDVTGRGIRWAVMDTGIDLRHVAFRRRSRDGELASNDAFASLPHAPRNPTRIVATYDFTILRTLLSAPRSELNEYVAGLPEVLRERIKRAGRGDAIAALQTALERTRGQLEIDEDGHHRIDPDGRSIDWSVWERLLQIPHTRDEYEPPLHPHGTHVAGILAADWRVGDLADDVVVDVVSTPRRLLERTGMCPEIELYDVRVLRPDGRPDEFAVLAALQFVRSLNARHNHLMIHGVNLSLSIPQAVSNYACGRTPVCEECDRLVNSGVIVVAAAGNYGREKYINAGGEVDEGFRTVSISDPGNAESVITVGATHRAAPHTYGVSYFSSRGPTGDGRAKPDLVAPGEKITAPVMREDEYTEESMDGTSMAAPHVSGAAALLLCRNEELIGQPAEVKRILCRTATDLGRDRYFQGAGLLDTLRALESF